MECRKARARGRGNNPRGGEQEGKLRVREPEYNFRSMEFFFFHSSLFSFFFLIKIYVNKTHIYVFAQKPPFLSCKAFSERCLTLQQPPPPRPMSALFCSIARVISEYSMYNTRI